MTTSASPSRSDMRVAVFGASGFVGATLTERLIDAGVDVRAFVNTSGNAWRMARRGIPIRQFDITQGSGIAEALAGCTHVVNCTRGSDLVMLEGLRRLLRGARAAGIRRFVHLSSVAVYGDPPPQAAVSEGAPAEPPRGSYGWLKLQQDLCVERAHAHGLDCVVLCPPNIGGPYSPFFAGLVDDLRRGRFVLLDDGDAPVNVVDVDNLCHAIELALTADQGDGRRIFITDGPKIRWRDLIDALVPLAGRAGPVPSLPLTDTFWSPRAPIVARSSPLRSLLHLLSSDVRAALRKDPMLESIDTTIRSLVARVPLVEAQLRNRVEGPIRVARIGEQGRYTSAFSRQQLRMVAHELGRAESVLGYHPERHFDAALERYARWYRETYILDNPQSQLIADMREMLAVQAD
ncbi:MAG: NAD(P)-dependent oxidoreductase [Acetobacteraceae bacterium]